MVKRIFLYTGLLTMIFAWVPTLATASEFDGFYTGISLGGTFRSGDGTSNTSLTTAPIPPINSGVSASAPSDPTTSLAFDVKRNAFLGVLSAGYGYTWCCEYYLGLEGYLSLSNYNRTSPVELVTFQEGVLKFAYTNSIKTKLNSFEFGVDLRPGYILCADTMLYGRVGIAFNRLSISANPAGSFMDGALNLGPGSLLLQRSSNRPALRLGLGLERRFWDCFSIRADYIYTWYGKMSVSGSATTPTSLGRTATISNTTTLNHLYGNAVMLGLFYYW